MTVCLLLALQTIMAGAVLPARAETLPHGLKPYQMVRSLQLVQDRIAGGDHAALPMQNRLLEMVDARLGQSLAREYEDPRNLHALFVYAMSGGNPHTVRTLLGRARLDEASMRAGEGIVAYLEGDLTRARLLFQEVEPSAHGEELDAFLSLVKATVIAPDTPLLALRLLDRARLLAPGTLVEEAALRRTIALARETDDADRFAAASSLYVRRFLRSPYAMQFAEDFVSGIIDFAARVDKRRIEEMVGWMDDDQARTVYLRLARASAIGGDSEMLAFATAMMEAYPGTPGSDDNAREELYTGISLITSQPAADMLNRLETLDASRLSDRDRALLRAATSVAREVIAPIAPQPAAADEATSAFADARTRRLVETARDKIEAIDRLIGGTDP